VAKKETPPESADRVGVGDASLEDGSMERFRHLTRRLLGVSNRQVQKERQRQDAKKDRSIKQSSVEDAWLWLNPR